MRIVGPGLVESFKARVCDVSKSGLRIHINRRVLVGSEVVVQLGEILVSAEARRCSEIDSDLYEVGLRITDIRESSKPAPRHPDVNDFATAPSFLRQEVPD